MATIGTITGSKLIGCPIVVPVTAGTFTGATFHRVRIVVTVRGSGSGTFEFSSPADNGDTVDFDISSAFRAVAGKHEYTNALSGYPSYTATIVAYDDYLKDGEEKHSSSSATTNVDTKYVGTLTDRERVTTGKTDASGASIEERPSKWTRKPTTSKEIVFFGLNYLAHGSFSSGPTTTAVNVADADGSPWNTTNQYNTYAIPRPADGYELRFINSLGTHDSAHIRCLMQSEVNIQTDRYVISRQETVTQFSRAVMHKQNDYEQWKMSSGPLDRAWQQWYLHEVLMAKWAWIKVDGQWLPVHIVPEETTVGIDRAGGKLLEVQFTLRFDINGSPFA